MNSQRQMLLQQRSLQKYHFGGLWTNACCSHPRRGESIEQAAHRRLREELGFDVPLRKLFSFIYEAHDAESGLTEREFDHVFIGHYDGQPSADDDEIAACKWIDVEELQRNVATFPERYTTWFRIALDKVIEHVRSGAAHGGQVTAA
jgi:isopentenyl-diphosphate delta-isomerase